MNNQFALFTLPHVVAEAHAGYTDTDTTTPVILPQYIERAAASWWSLFTPAQRERINGRFERGKAIALAGDVSFTNDPQTYSIRSQSTKGNYRYIVCLDADNRSCSCPDFVDAPGHVCKHIVAANILHKGLEISQAELQPQAQADEPASDEVVSMNYQMRRPKDNIIYAALSYQDKTFPVEILWAENGRAIVRALPKFEKKAMVPVFPFPSPFGGDNSPCWSTAEVEFSALSNVKIFTC